MIDINIYCLNIVHVIIAQSICECRLGKINWLRVQRSLDEENSKEQSPNLLGLRTHICKVSMTISAHFPGDLTRLAHCKPSKQTCCMSECMGPHGCQWHGKLQRSVLGGSWTNLWPLRLFEEEAQGRQGMNTKLASQGGYVLVSIPHLDDGILVKAA